MLIFAVLTKEKRRRVATSPWTQAPDVDFAELNMDGQMALQTFTLSAEGPEAKLFEQLLFTISSGDIAELMTLCELHERENLTLADSRGNNLIIYAGLFNNLNAVM